MYNTAYKGEYFYTVTSLPFYVKRRELLLCQLEKEIALKYYEQEQKISILDFGCGDGYYTLWLKRKFPHTQVKGCDLSLSMIDSARENAKKSGYNIEYNVSDSNIPFPEKFDIIVVIAVLAHVLEDSLLETIVNDIAAQLKIGGRVIIFEATAQIPRNGATWARRTPLFYETLFTRYRLSLKKNQLVSFPFFLRMDKLVSMTFQLPISGLLKILPNNSPLKNKITKIQSNLNKLWFYILIDEILLFLSRYMDRFFSENEGNSVMIFEKTE